MSIAGQRSTADILSAKLKIQMDEKIALLQPEKTPLITFLKLAQGKTIATANPKFSWLEDDLAARWDAVDNAAGYAANATSIAVDNGDFFQAGDQVKVPRTQEVMLVTAVSSDTLTVVRGYGVTAAAALVDNDPVVIIGNVNQEGAAVRALRSANETEVFNYTQIFRTAFGVTGTNAASDTYGGDDIVYQEAKKGIEHAMDINRAFMFGEKKLDTTGTKVARATGGLLSFLSANNYAAGGALTQDEFDQNICEKAFKYGSSEKLMLASARVVSVINTWALGKYEVKSGEETFGLSIMKYISPFGILNIVYDPMLEGAIYGGYAAILDPENIAYRPLKGRDTSLRRNIQAPDIDGITHEYLTEAGLQVKSPKTHALLTGVSSAS